MSNKRNLKVVLDSVVLVSAFLTKGLTWELVSLCREKANLYTAEEILQEVRRVLLGKDYIRRRYKYSNEEVEIFLGRLRESSDIVSSLPEVRVVKRDPKDDMIIACAVAVQADYIVSRDLDLLDLKTYQGIQIVPPEDFIHHLRDEPQGARQGKKYMKVKLPD